MTIEKKRLAELEACYAVTAFPIEGKETLLFATEGEGACLAFSGTDFAEESIVWEGPGGTMSMVPIPGKKGEFLAVQKFFKLFDWDEAVLVWVKPQARGGFALREILKLPYIHRFDLFASEGRIHFLACTLAEKKDSREDWSRAGKAYVGVLPGDWDRPIELRVLKDGLFQNHGYSRSSWKGREAGLVTSREGAFAFTPPGSAEGDWSVERFMDWPISDIAACDLDGDGELEYATIEPWHGEHFRVYKRGREGFELIYEHPEVSEFYHVAQGTTLRGRPAIIGGCRRGSQHLFYLVARSRDPLVLEAVNIENGVGPSNLVVLHEADRDLICSANREKGEAAVYFIRD